MELDRDVALKIAKDQMWRQGIRDEQRLRIAAIHIVDNFLSLTVFGIPLKELLDEVCPTCNGDTVNTEIWDTCPTCGKSGRVPSKLARIIKRITPPCSRCGGKKEVKAGLCQLWETCLACQGTGLDKIQRDKISIKESE